MSSFVYQHTRKRHLPAPHFPKRLASLPTAPGAYAVTTLASHYMNMTALNAILTHKLEGLPDKHACLYYLLDG